MLNAFAWLANRWRVGLYLYSLPTLSQARLVIWDAITADGKRLLDYIPRDLIATGKDGKPAINESEMSITFTNGSILRLIGGDNYNRVVGAGAQAICYSEWPLTDPSSLDYFRPIITANDGITAFIFTPRGNNHGKEVYDQQLQLARENPKRYFCQLLTVEDTGAISSDAIARDRAEGMSEELIQQEYYCDFSVANQATYYGKAMSLARGEGRVGAVPHNALLPVYTFWDIGISDDTSIVFVQKKGTAIYVIDYYANSGEDGGH